MKHAYLIMAHNEPYILEKLLLLIDDERNDIYLHIDKKWKNFDKNYFCKLISKSRLFFTECMDVRWGTYSQIKCEILLLKTASQNKKYNYYHLISGVDMPLVNQNVIHDFFDKNQGKEFVSFDSHNSISENAISRIRYYHIFSKNLRNNNKLISILSKVLYHFSLTIQKVFKIDRLRKKSNLEIRKGANWVSITDDLVRYILSKEVEIQKVFSKSFCADELLLQTIVYNSHFYKHLISYNNNDYIAIKRYVDWKRGNPYIFRSNDYEEIINSNCFFARKFSTKTDKEIIDKIYDYVEKSSKDMKSKNNLNF